MSCTMGSVGCGASRSTQAGMTDLAGISARQVVDDFDRLRRHVALEMREAVLDDVAWRERATRAQCDIRLHRLAECVVWDADDGATDDAVECVDHVLDLTRSNLFAARLDDVVAARHEVQETLGIGPEQVAGVEGGFAINGPRPQAL